MTSVVCHGIDDFSHGIFEGDVVKFTAVIEKVRDTAANIPMEMHIKDTEFAKIDLAGKYVAFRDGEALVGFPTKTAFLVLSRPSDTIEIKTVDGIQTQFYAKRLRYATPGEIEQFQGVVKEKESKLKEKKVQDEKKTRLEEQDEKKTRLERLQKEIAALTVSEMSEISRFALSTLLNSVSEKEKEKETDNK